MPIADLSFEDQEIVLSALKAVLSGPFISDAAFPTRLGASRNQLAKLIEAWPESNDSDLESIDSLLIHNCLNEVCHGIRFTKSPWDIWFAVTRERVKDVFDRWKEASRK